MDENQPIPFLRTRLSVQMFLQFAIWGAWVPVLGNHLAELKFNGKQIGMVYLTGSLASMISPLIAGQIADRLFATQTFLSVSYALSGIMFILCGQAREYSAVWWFAFTAMLFFSPTLGLANSLSFHHLKDPKRDFPLVRLWGTIGWIAAGWTLGYWMQFTGRPIGDSLYIGGVLSIINAVYVLTLPHTPPRKDEKEPFAIGKVLAMLSDPSFAIFSFLAFAILVFATFYYNFAGLFFEKGVGIAQANVSKVMSIGQIMEITTMVVLAFTLRRLGTKATIAIGMAAWALRFAIFSLGTPWQLVVAAQALHGVCFAFAIAAAMIYVDHIAAADVRGSMQSFLAFMTYGFGMTVGSWLAGDVLQNYTEKEVIDWHSVWMVPAIGCAAVLVAFLVGFKSRDTVKIEPVEAPVAVAS